MLNVDFLTSLVVTSKEGLEACLLLIAIMRTRNTIAEQNALMVGVVLGLLWTAMAFYGMHAIMESIKASMVVLTSLTIIVLLYLASSKHNGTGWRTKFLMRMSASQSLGVLGLVGALLVLREGLEVVIATSSMAIQHEFSVAWGVVCGCALIGGLSRIVHSHSKRFSRQAMFRWADWSFMVMAGYYFYEMLNV